MISEENTVFLNKIQAETKQLIKERTKEKDLNVKYTYYFDDVAEIINSANTDYQELFCEFLKREYHSKSLYTFLRYSIYYRLLFRNVTKNDIKSFSLQKFKSLFDLGKESVYKRICFQFLAVIYDLNLNDEMIANHNKYKFLHNNIIAPIVKSLYYSDTIPNINSLVTIEVTPRPNHDISYALIDIGFPDAYITSILTDNVKIINSGISVYVAQKFCKKMGAYMEKNNIKDINTQINDEFINAFLKEVIESDENMYLISTLFFKNILDNQPVNTCILYDGRVLTSKPLKQVLAKKGRVVIYNKFDDVPNEDIWLLKPNSGIRYSTEIKPDSLLVIDFSEYINNQLKKSAKRYFWYRNASLMTSSKENTKIKDFCNMFYTDKLQKIIIITEDIAAAYKTYIIKKYSVTETRCGRLNPIVGFLKYLNDEENVFVRQGCYSFLKSNGPLKKGEAKGIPDDDLAKIAIYYNEKKYDSFEDTAMYVAFYIAISTEFRISQIMNLDINCIKESMKKNQFIIVSPTKVSEGDLVEQPCALIVKRIIESYIRYTSSDREKCNDDIVKNKLFLYYSKQKKDYSVYERRCFTDHLGDVCQKLELPKYTAKHVRTTHITKVKEFVKENKLSDLTLMGATGHKSIAMIDDHYIENKIKEAIEAAHNLIIGDVDLKGKVLKDASSIITKSDNIVENGCGYCQTDSCNANAFLSCLLCKHFATTVDRIPFFEAAVGYFGKKAIEAKNKHDRESAIAMKSLCGKYLYELELIKGVKIDVKYE